MPQGCQQRGELRLLPQKPLPRHGGGSTAGGGGGCAQPSHHMMAPSCGEAPADEAVPPPSRPASPVRSREGRVGGPPGPLRHPSGLRRLALDDVEDVNSMEKVMLEYAAMDRELNHYMKAIEETVNQLKQEKPENIPDLKYLVKEKFTALESKNSDSDLEKNEKYMYFKDQLKEMRKQFRLQSDNNDNDAIEQIDEDIAVTQSQVNFICPITQVEMKKPVRNKVCGHSYEQDAILKIIQTRKQQKKNVRCPKIGCSHDDVKESDLVPDEALKRAIDSQNKQSWSTL
ncbi:E3 SUMO-protein ligase NSE2 isoform X1 [Cygnus olor]|uniref:E3 SUMO-protein ligase NSE2 isoform X1 n=1 Tax=Cygnus olor TaxID=8869 RepID=UPI001ADEB6A7|nr:E3 SUMO-protein ligase NSE2 isoform X1 [Cygnus olor]